MDISVIIPSLRSWPLIGETLRALAAQDFAGTVEIIVVDSSADATPSEIASHFPTLTLIHSRAPLFPGAARNRGLERATGILVAFVDADAVPALDWLSTLWTLHANHPEWVGIGGSIANANESVFIARLAHLLEFSGYTPGWPARVARVIPTCNLSFKREALGADLRFLEESWGNEDVELVERLRAQHAIIRFEPTLRVAHYSKTDFAAVCAQQRKLGESTALARRRYDLPGSWLARIPLAWCLTPALKLGILWRRALTHERGAVGLLILGTPWLWVALFAWMAGFRRGLHLPLPGDPHP